MALLAEANMVGMGEGEEERRPRLPVYKWEPPVSELVSAYQTTLVVQCGKTTIQNYYMGPSTWFCKG
jgi:hypothetical protein